MRLKFAKSGFHGFHDYEVLEFLLFFIFPRIDTKDIAKNLLKRFHSFHKVLDATIDEIAEVPGMGTNSAISLKAMRNALHYYFEDRVISKTEKITNISGLVKYLQSAIGGYHNEVLFVIYLNSQNDIVHKEIIAEGTNQNAIAYPRKVVESALKYRSTGVILAHNHPGGNCQPSQEDINLTNEIKKNLNVFEINLMDHIIIGENDYYSFVVNRLI